MNESIKVFKEILSYVHTLKGIPIILVFTNSDSFEETLEDYPLEDYFPEYQGRSKENAFDFIHQKFLDQNESDKMIYTFLMNVLDENNVKMFWKEVNLLIQGKKIAKNYLKVFHTEKCKKYAKLKKIKAKLYSKMKKIENINFHFK